MTETSGWATPGAAGSPSTPRPPMAPVTAFDGPRRPPGPPQTWAGRQQHPVDTALSRPTFREAHKSTSAGILSGASIAVIWLIITTFLGTNLASVLWVILAASGIATGAAFLLARYGDRGAAAGIAAVSGAAVAVVGLVVEWQHLLNETWVLW